MENKKNLLILFLVFMIIPVGLFIEQQFNKPAELTVEEQKHFDNAIEEADKYSFFGEHEKEIDKLQDALQMKPEDVDVLYNLYCTQYNAKQYEQAEETLKKLEQSEKDSANYWYLRAQNLNKIPNNLKNIKLAVEYIEKSNEILGAVEKSPLQLEDEANIYLEAYKYYRSIRKDTDVASKAEIEAKTKFLNVIEEFKRNRYAQHDNYWFSVREDLYNQYKSFPNRKYVSPYANAPELEKLTPTQEDYENWQEFRKNKPAKK